MPDRSTVADEAHVWLLILATAGASLAFGPAGGRDGQVVAEATVVVLAALLAAGVATWAGVRNGAVECPRAPVITATAVLAAMMVARVALASEPVRGLAGAFGRWNGLVLTLACLVLFLVAVVRGTDTGSRRVIRGLVSAGIVVGVLGLDEAFFGLGPSWGSRYAAAGPLGNANFLGAWTAAVLPAAIMLAADRSEPRSWRVVGAVALPALLAGMVVSRSLQAGYVAAAALAVLGLAWVANHVARRVLRLLVGGALLAGVTVGVLTVLGALQRGPLALLSDQVGVRLRVEYWAAAGRMVSDHPLTGVGPGMFADRFREFRSPAAAAMVSVESTADAAHNVPLHLAAEWGTPVAIAHLVVLLLVGVAAVRELRRRTGRPRLRYAAVVAVWVGYALQSIISIDTPPLMVLGWVLAGLVVAPQTHERWTLDLPWRRPGRGRPLPLQARVSAAAVTVVMVAGAWASTLPIRADASAANVQIEARDEPPGVAARMVELAPWEVEYWLHLIRHLDTEEELEQIAAVLDHAQRLSPGRFELVASAARAAVALDRPDQAGELYERALELEPWHPVMLFEVARFAEAEGDNEWADELRRRARWVSHGREASGAWED